jgi:hypothetical protein
MYCENYSYGLDQGIPVKKCSLCKKCVDKNYCGFIDKNKFYYFHRHCYEYILNIEFLYKDFFD